MSELSADAEREIRKFLEDRNRQEEERQRRFLNRVLQIAGLLLASVGAGLAAAFYFFVDSVENKAIAEARRVAVETVQTNIGTTSDIVSARADIVSAERQAEELAERAAAILNRIRETREYVNGQAAKIEALEPLFGVAQNVVDLKEALANDLSFRRAIKGDIDPAPPGLIAAFASDAGVDDTTNQCPQGWSVFHEATGRFVVGAGAATPPLSSRAPFSTGGNEVVRLNDTHLPRHRHEVLWDDKHTISLNNSRGDSAGDNQYRLEWRGGAGLAGNNMSATWEGEDQPHNNMPPYIALYFCKKD